MEYIYVLQKKETRSLSMRKLQLDNCPRKNDKKHSWLIKD